MNTTDPPCSFSLSPPPAKKKQDRDLATLFANCLPNTLDTTVRAVNDTDAFVITGQWGSWVGFLGG